MGSSFTQQDKVRGITTAIILWVLACIGLLIGSGYIMLALVSSNTILFALTFIRNTEVFFIKKHKKRKECSTTIQDTSHKYNAKIQELMHSIRNIHIRKRNRTITFVVRCRYSIC